MPLTGTWITSYSGWMHFNPRPERETRPISLPLDEDEALFAKRAFDLPPLIGGFRWVPPFSGPGLHGAKPQHEEIYQQREGYFLFAAVACFKFESDFTLKGHAWVNRGGNKKSVFQNLTGTYSMDATHDLEEVFGRIETVHDNTGGEVVHYLYNYIMRNEDEIYFSWDSSFEAGNPDDIWRGQVLHGVLRRENFVNDRPARPIILNPPVITAENLPDLLT